jgi:hypothetical protein
MRQRLRDWITGTTPIVSVVDSDGFDSVLVDVAECCGIGPITSREFYCPKCGKRIVKK